MVVEREGRGTPVFNSEPNLIQLVQQLDGYHTLIINHDSETDENK